MVSLGSLWTSVVTGLETDPSMSNVSFVYRYPPYVKENPLRGITIALGYEKIQYYHPYNDQPTQQVMRVIISMNIHAPMTGSGSQCYDTFNSMSDVLLKNIYKPYDLSCDEVEFDRTTATLVLKTRAEYRFDM